MRNTPAINEYIELEMTIEQERRFMPPNMDERLPHSHDQIRDELLRMIASERLHMKVTFPQYPIPIDPLEYDMLCRMGEDMSNYRVATTSDLPRIFEYYDVQDLLRWGAAK